MFGIGTCALAGRATPIEGFPESVLGAVSPFLDLFCGHQSPAVVNIFENDFWLRFEGRGVGGSRLSLSEEKVFSPDENIGYTHGAPSV